MAMKLTASRLRQDIYSILDQVLDTGVPVEIQRHGRRLRIVPDQKLSKLARLKKHNRIVGDLDSLIHLDWSKEWTGAKLPK
jgi:hypothetical protein